MNSLLEIIKRIKEIVKNKNIFWYLYLFQHQLFNYIN